MLKVLVVVDEDRKEIFQNADGWYIDSSVTLLQIVRDKCPIGEFRKWSYVRYMDD